MKPIVFIDTETLGLRLEDPIWEIAMIRRTDDLEIATRFTVAHDPSAADGLPKSFRDDYDARYDDDEAWTRTDAADTIMDWLRPSEDGKAVIVGSAPDFDMTRIQLQLGVEQIWHHHLIDAPTLAMGWWYHDHKARVSFPPSLDEAAKMFGIDPRPGRHTATADCELARDIFDRATHGRYGGVA